MPYVNYFEAAYEPINMEEMMRMVHANARQRRRPFGEDAPRIGNFEKKKEPMRNKVFDEKTRELIEPGKDGYTYGIVYVSKDYVEFGWFKSSPDNIVVVIKEGWRGLGGRTYPGISREALPELLWSNKSGYYVCPYNLSAEEINSHKIIRGQGNFPYQFPKHYEAAESFHLFKDAQRVLEEVEYPLAKELKYTFGLEFETSMGYIPQEKCFRDGLIPLRDGSISGIEYSTVVLEGNKGLNLLKQELDTLKEHTMFNKECALHIHMGGFPVDHIAIYALYSLWYGVERDLVNRGYVPRLTFNTARYKANGKDYCKMLSGNSTFEDVFEAVTGKKYLGSLVQPHPADIEKRAKWNIKARYYGLNLVNMLCYKGPKTVEFRFLRPSFNYRKITLWLYILNAVLKYAERLAQEWKKEGHCDTEGMITWIVRGKYNGLKEMLMEVYPDKDTIEYLFQELYLLRTAVAAQQANGDDYGRDTIFEDELFV